jgi:hypothetical protein
MTGTTISGSYSAGIPLFQAADNPVLVTGTIAASTGFALYGTSDIDWTVTNAGSLGGASFGVLLPGGGSVTNQNGAAITASGGPGNAVQLATSVTNNGLISASGYGVFGASSVDNQNLGTIIGVLGGVNAGTVVNAGTIQVSGDQRAGVLLNANGVVTNQSGGIIVSSSGYGVEAANGTLVNGGLISGAIYGVVRASYVTNQNTGTIIGGRYGLDLTAGSVVNAGSISSTSADSTGIVLSSGGSVTNAVGGVISGVGYGVKISGAAGTVENAGTIAGTSNAVEFGGTLVNRLIVDPGAVFDGTVDGGAGSTSTLELASGGAGALGGLGSQYLNFSRVVVDSGATWTLTGDNTLAAGITLAAGATLEVAGTVATNETIVFAGHGAELVVDSTASMAGSVTSFGQNETIDLRNVDAASVSYSGDGQLDYTAPGGGSAFFPLSINVGGPVQALTDGAGGADVTALCFCAGTLLATPAGEVPVEQLAAGDMVLTATGAARPIVWIGVGRVLAARGRRSAATPVIVRKGALADNVPHHDLHVTKGHGLWLDGVLIPVEFLVNHRSIMWDDRAQEVALYHVELDCHDVLVANGAPAESYRDDGNRWLFANANSGWDLPPLAPCAPIMTGGAVVDAVWRRLLERAGARPGVPVTDDPDLHLLADGARVEVAWRRGAARLFRVPARPDCVRVVSRIGVPQELGWARDPRPLGVALRHLVLRQAARVVVVEAEDARLVQGFHAYEHDVGVRWTDGDAVLPAELFEGFGGPVELELHLGGTTQYLADPMVLAA